MNLDEAIRLLDESPFNLLLNEELNKYIMEIPDVGARIFQEIDDDKCIGMVNIIGASVYAMLMSSGQTEIKAIDKNLVLSICAVAMRATAGLLTMEEIR